MNDTQKSAWGGSLISRRRMLHYGLAGMAGIAGGLWPLSAFGKTNLMSGTKTGGRSYFLFSEHPTNPDRLLANIHPRLKNARTDNIFITIQEENLVRVAEYDSDLRVCINRMNCQNNSGLNLTGLPAGNPDDFIGAKESCLQFGNDIVLCPSIPESKLIGSKEWPNNMTWQHVWENYYIVTIYRSNFIVFEDLVTERKSIDLTPFLGESSLKPGHIPFSASWGGDILMLPSTINEEDFPLIYLDYVLPERLPADFPTGLVRWIP